MTIFQSVLRNQWLWSDAREGGGAIWYTVNNVAAADSFGFVGRGVDVPVGGGCARGERFTGDVAIGPADRGANGVGWLGAGEDFHGHRHGAPGKWDVR